MWKWVRVIWVLLIISTFLIPTIIYAADAVSYKQIGASGSSGFIVIGGSVSHLYLGWAGQVTLPPYTDTDPGTGVLSGDPLMPPQMYTELDTSKIPGGAIVDDILAESDTPAALWWFPFIFGLIGILALLLYGLTVKTGGQGSELIMVVVIEAGLILFGIMGATGTSSIIPLFPAFLFLIPGIGIILSKKHYGWG